jgi:hypothetical protein
MRILVAVAVAIAMGVLIGRFTVQPVVRAQGGCTNATLTGAYAHAMNGFFYYSDGSQGVFAAAARTVADGNGGFTGTETVNFDGTPQKAQAYTGTYTVNSDCTGTASFKDSNGTVDVAFVITNGGKQAQMVSSAADFIVSGTLNQQ